jgi:acyl-coenzyme A synthetase/AMP-(fatty) acid ligase
VFRGPWYYSGDVLARDADGYFWFKGRNDDVIKASGYRISPFEVESCLVAHDAVLEAAVVASPDPERGAVVKAFVVLRDGVEPSAALAEAIRAHVRQSAAPYKCPRKLEFVAALPKTPSGKVKRRELRQREVSDVAKPSQ